MINARTLVGLLGNGLDCRRCTKVAHGNHPTLFTRESAKLSNQLVSAKTSLGPPLEGSQDHA